MIMKNILLSNLFALITTLGFSQAPSYVPVNGLVGWWPFNGNADDESGNGNNGTLINGPNFSSDRNGIQNSSIQFTTNVDVATPLSVGQYILVPNQQSLNPINFTISVWINPLVKNACIVAKNNPNNCTEMAYELVYDDEFQGLQGVATVIGDETCNTGYCSWSQPGLVPDSIWSNIVFTFENSMINQYMNGILIHSNNSNITTINCNSINSTLRFGGLHWNNDAEWFKGKIDDIGIWNRALTDCEIQNLYTSTNPTNTTTATTCDTYTWNGQTYTQSGVYTGPTANCVTESLNLTITPSSTNTTTATSCDSYVWNGTTYSASGVYTGTTTNCVTQALNLTITPSSTNTTSSSACDSYVWNGTSYSASGVYTGTTSNCVTESLNLNITPSSTNTTTAATCESYIWNGTTYSASGVYTGTTTNCVTEFLNLTITPSSTNTTTASACNSYTWNGQTYTQSGLYTGTTANCVTQALNLTINPSTSSSISQTALDSYTWPVNNQSYTTSGAYTAVIPNAAGCDSTITLNLTMSFTGINDISTSKISIYPNPTNGDFTITGLELLGTVSSLTLTDMNGKVVKVLDTKATKFSMASIKPGVYFLNIRADNKQEVLKIVKE